MSKTTEVKELITYYLSDDKTHEVADIKRYIRERYREPLTEGIIAGAIKTMTTGGIIENIERGKYRLVKKNQESEDANNGNSICRQILELTNQYEQEVIRIINMIEITEENMAVITTGVKLRKKIENLCLEVRNVLD